MAVSLSLFREKEGVERMVIIPGLIRRFVVHSFLVGHQMSFFDGFGFGGPVVVVVSVVGVVTTLGC